MVRLNLTGKKKQFIIPLLSQCLLKLTNKLIRLLRAAACVS